MNRERGASSLILALLILLLGSLLLQGVNQQQASYASRVATQSLAIQRQALVQSALEWGRGQLWSGVDEMECRRYSSSGAKVCLRRLSGDEVVMAAQDDGMTLWRLGNVIQGSIVFSPHGWSDFCPLKEVALCRIP
ncbi:DUF2509 family protein [Salmonella enterica]|nr:DUF2509 family protein [Salmonella enterica]EBR0108797.1 DUF2509 family protein [Salmonella enterica subsp. houtenae serovar Houten]EDQ3385393.1 DUF2509 family protein [Salmonella enterica subsp. houtenae]EHY68557.1 hypothetical protein SEHO0A_03046 [Salmonella enterica subsp. houtenae str. ATCC BAA-1581]EAO3142819.1 DUF2509 family protein [Salmonella enterica]EAQ7363882.1 DUF2509 family protein [Salmonella enterica]